MFFGWHSLLFCRRWSSGEGASVHQKDTWRRRGQHQPNHDPHSKRRRCKCPASGDPPHSHASPQGSHPSLSGGLWHVRAPFLPYLFSISSPCPFFFSGLGEDIFFCFSGNVWMKWSVGWYLPISTNQDLLLRTAFTFFYCVVYQFLLKMWQHFNLRNLISDLFVIRIDFLKEGCFVSLQIIFGSNFLLHFFFVLTFFSADR